MKFLHRIPQSLIDQIENNMECVKINKNSVVLVGGCSRAGKTCFSNELSDMLTERGISSLVLSIDHWLLPVTARPANSTVLQRYRLNEIIESVANLLAGNAIKVSIYDSRSRRLNPKPTEIVPCAAPFVLIIEGTISLAIEQFRKISCCNVFIDVSDCTRLRALISFYKYYKKMSPAQYRQLIKNRENEEVPFLKKTAQFSQFRLAGISKDLAPN